MLNFSKRVLKKTGRDISFFFDEYAFECRIAGQTEESINLLGDDLKDEIFNNIIEINETINQKEDKHFKLALDWTINKLEGDRIKVDFLTSSNNLLLDNDNIRLEFFRYSLRTGSLAFNPIGLHCTDATYVPSLYHFSLKFRKLYPGLIVNKNGVSRTGKLQYIDRAQLATYGEIVLVPSYILKVVTKLYHPYIFNLLATGNLINKLL